MASAASDRNKACTDCKKLRVINREEQNKIALSNQLSSPLLRLPNEIRNMIYTHICISTTVNHGHPKNGSKEGCAFTQTFLLTSSQIYAEAVELMYSLATFDLSSGSVDVPKLLCLKSLNPEYRHLITSIQVNAKFAEDAIFLIEEGKVEEVLGDHSPAECLFDLERLHVRDLYWADVRMRDELRYLFDMEGLIITDHATNGLPRWSPEEPFTCWSERV